MEFLKKFAKELSVFGIVIIVFLGLFTYRQLTFKDYATINQKELTQMAENKEDFVVVVGDSTDSTMKAYQDIMTDYTTKNRSIPLYYIDTNNQDKIDEYIEKTFKINVQYPATLIVKDGKVTAKKETVMQLYALTDYIKENFQ